MAKVWKKAAALATVFLLLLGMAVPVWADEDEDYPIVAGDPEIVLVNGPVFDVTAGKENEVKLTLRNNSNTGAHSLIVQASLTDPANSPFQVAFKGTDNKIGQVNAKYETTCRLLVTVDETAPSQTYSLDLSYTFYNRDGKKYTGKNTVYLRVENRTATPNFVVEQLAIDPASMSAGGSATFSGRIRNDGPLDMYEVKVSLEGLAADGISVTGVNSQSLGTVGAGTRQNFAFTIVAAPGMAAGNYPITVKLNYVNASGKALEYSQAYYVNVGGSTGTTLLEIQNMKEPAGNYGVNQNFTVSFDLVNVGTGSVKDIVVSATADGGSGTVVPKSNSRLTVASLAAGEKKTLSFTFAATAGAKDQNYPIAFTVETKSGLSFTQYAGVNVSGGGDSTSKPKIIVSDYACDPLIVMAGEEFNLSMTFLNTHSQKTVKNVKMYLTMQEETSTTDTKTGNIFTPVDSSNTFYFDSISPKGTATKTLRMYALPDAQPKTYTIKVNFEYEDASGTEYTATELLGINVKQPTEISLGDIYVPEMLDAGTPVYLSFELYNTGKVAVSNLMVTIEGENVTAAAKNTYLGNFNSGDVQYYDGSFTAFDPGQGNVNILVSYDDPSGEHIEIPHEFSFTVNEPMPIDEGMDDPSMYPPESTGPSTKTIVLIVVIAAVAAVVVVVVVKKHRAKVAEARLMEDDGEADEADDEKK